MHVMPCGPNKDVRTYLGINFGSSALLTRVILWSRADIELTWSAIAMASPFPSPLLLRMQATGRISPKCRARCGSICVSLASGQKTEAASAPHRIMSTKLHGIARRTRPSSLDKAMCASCEFQPSTRQINREMCAKDQYVPNFSEDIEYVCLTKTHFVHAQNRYLFNSGELESMISWRDDDEEGLMIQTAGPVCVVYNSGSFKDRAAMHALAAEDNQNAAVQWEKTK
jgi:hypothetical protein